ncbi:hypothetical protein [Primorskyibacter sedentarius]|uniref:hypothetical protein n=1 Tax=Primorskyibacter sedentarius TaxID=745311 RepID=UPI003EBB42D6
MTIRKLLPPPADFTSDGCTVPWFLRWYFRRYTQECRAHDWARRHLVYYGITTVEEADAKLYRDWVNAGMPRWFARLSWNVVKFKRSKYKITQPFPADKPHWYEYLRA